MCYNLGREVDSSGGRHYCRVGFVSGQAETWSYKIVMPPDLRGHCALSVAVTEERKGSWAQNCEGGNTKRNDK